MDYALGLGFFYHAKFLYRIKTREIISGKQTDYT